MKEKIKAHIGLGRWFAAPFFGGALLMGAAGAVIAVLAEKFTKTTKYVDDNLTIPLASALVMALLHIYFS